MARVEKLDAASGDVLWKRTVDLTGKVVIQGHQMPHRVSITGWVDPEGCVYVSSGWSGHSLWRFDAELKTELWQYTAPFRERYWST